MLENAEQGIWPSAAPLGYRNVDGANGKRVIEPDPDVASQVMKLFEWYAAGGLALRDLVKKAREVGFSYRKSGKPVPTSTVHKILRNRLYMGEFEWNGRLYQGSHQPLVTRELWERVQDVLDDHVIELRLWRSEHWVVLVSLRVMDLACDVFRFGHEVVVEKQLSLAADLDRHVFHIQREHDLLVGQVSPGNPQLILIQRLGQRRTFGLVPCSSCRHQADRGDRKENGCD